MGSVVVDIVVDTMVWAISEALRAVSCHVGSTMVESEVPPFEQFEIVNLKNSWGELWKQNTTFWDAIGHFWWALGTTQVSFSWTT